VFGEPGNAGLFYFAGLRSRHNVAADAFPARRQRRSDHRCRPRMTRRKNSNVASADADFYVDRARKQIRIAGREAPRRCAMRFGSIASVSR